MEGYAEENKENVLSLEYNNMAGRIVTEKKIGSGSRLFTLHINEKTDRKFLRCFEELDPTLVSGISLHDLK
jgi:hypothetical protein